MALFKTVVENGALAGFVGTGVMTAVQMIDMKVEHKGPSTTPAKALEKATPIQLHGEQQRERVANVVHFVYGTAWGEARALVSRLGLHGLPASLVHLGLVWGTAARMLPALDLAPPVREWSRKELGKDLLFHAIYAAVTGSVYDALDRRARRQRAIAA